GRLCSRPPPSLTHGVAAEEAGRRTRHVAVAAEEGPEGRTDLSEPDIAPPGGKGPRREDRVLMERRKGARDCVVDDLLPELGDEHTRPVSERLGFGKIPVRRRVAVDRQLADPCH